MLIRSGVRGFSWQFTIISSPQFNCKHENREYTVYVLIAHTTPLTDFIQVVLGNTFLFVLLWGEQLPRELTIYTKRDNYLQEQTRIYTLLFFIFYYVCSVHVQTQSTTKQTLVSNNSRKESDVLRNLYLSTFNVKSWVLKALSVLMLCAPVFIFTFGSSALLGRPRCGLSIWQSLLAIFNTLFWV